MNTSARLRIPAVAVIVGAVTMTTLLSGCGPALGGTGSTGGPSPSASPSLAPSPTTSATRSPVSSPSPASTATTIGSLTLTSTGCTLAGDTSGLPAGPVRFEVSNASPDDAGFSLFVLSPGHTYQELATALEGYDTQAHQDPTSVQISPDMAAPDGLVGLLSSGATKVLEATVDLASGSTAGIACWRGDVATGSMYDVYAVGPLEFE